MGLKVGFETFEGGTWKHLQLKDNDTFFWKAITVGAQNFKLVGKQHEVCNWLISHPMPVKCANGFGRSVKMTCSGIMPHWRDVYLEQFAGAFAGGGSVMGVFGSFLAGTGGDTASTIFSAFNTPTQLSVDAADGSIRGKLFGKKVIVTFMPGITSTSREAKKEFRAPSLELPSGLSTRFYGNGLKDLSP
jgi:hypothetical protein